MMKLKSKAINIISATAIIFGLTACSGGDSSTETTLEIITGHFIDEAVQGLTYECNPGGKSGVTDNNGTYICYEGDTVTFSFNGLTLGTTTVQSVVTPLHLYPSKEDREFANNMVQLLHSFDTDGNPDNGIQLDDSVDLTSIDLTQDSNSFQNTLYSVLASSTNTTLALYNREEAQAKMYSYFKENDIELPENLDVDIDEEIATLEISMCNSGEKLQTGVCVELENNSYSSDEENTAGSSTETSSNSTTSGLGEEETIIVDESNETELIPTLVLTPIDDDVEDQLADALLKAQNSLALALLSENKFIMGTGEDDWLLDYHIMAKSYIQAVDSLNELIEIHDQMELIYTKRVVTTRNFSRTDCDSSTDPYCITNAQHKKIDFYLDHFGETTPGGQKIDIKTIAQRTKQSIEFIADLVQEKYGLVAQKETREAAKWQHYENVADTISTGADIITASAGFGTGVQAFKAGLKYAAKKSMATTLLKNATTKPSTITTAMIDTLGEHYLTSITKESPKLLLKAREEILQGSWDILSNGINMYNKYAHLGAWEKSERLENAQGMVDLTGTIFNLTNITKTILNPQGISNILVTKNPLTGKKDIVFISDSLAAELVVENILDGIALIKTGLTLAYDENGNLLAKLSEVSEEEKEQIISEIEQEQIEVILIPDTYEYSDENNITQTLVDSSRLDVAYIDQEYQKEVEITPIVRELTVENDITECTYLDEMYHYYEGLDEYKGCKVRYIDNYGILQVEALDYYIKINTGSINDWHYVLTRKAETTLADKLINGINKNWRYYTCGYMDDCVGGYHWLENIKVYEFDSATKTSNYIKSIWYDRHGSIVNNYNWDTNDTDYFETSQ